MSWVSQFINLNGAEFLVEKMVELDRKPRQDIIFISYTSKTIYSDGAIMKAGMII